MKNRKSKILEVLKRFKDKTVDVTSDVISAPSRLKSNFKMKRAESDSKILQEAKKYDKAPDLDDTGAVTDAFKTRSLARDIKKRIGK